MHQTVGQGLAIIFSGEGPPLPNVLQSFGISCMVALVQSIFALYPKGSNPSAESAKDLAAPVESLPVDWEEIGQRRSQQSCGTTPLGQSETALGEELLPT